MGTGSLPVTESGLFPAEHRALRELYAMARQLGGHWARLSERLGGEPAVLEKGVAAARELLDELPARTAPHDLHGSPAARGSGAWLSRFRGASDLVLERNQALRSAVLDIQHITTLLGYLGELAERRGDGTLATWHRGWEKRLRDLEAKVRAAAVAQGSHPERAIEPAANSPAGRAGHAVANGLGTLGEAFDARVARRKG
jgi:hypothetical protein